MREVARPLTWDDASGGNTVRRANPAPGGSPHTHVSEPVLSSSAHERAPSAVSPSTTFAYQPALDGLRAVSVALVLVFHGGFRG
jgi:hypothetical protein